MKFNTKFDQGQKVFQLSWRCAPPEYIKNWYPWERQIEAFQVGTAINNEMCYGFDNEDYYHDIDFVAESELYATKEEAQAVCEEKNKLEVPVKKMSNPLIRNTGILRSDALARSTEANLKFLKNLKFQSEE